MSSSSSPCAACKFLRRKCAQGCIFAPYFPPENQSKFSNVHRVFGASNIAKLLADLSPDQREDAVNSLSYEAEARINDPVYGCVGYISLLQHRLVQLQRDLSAAKRELSNYINHAAVGGPNNQFYATPPSMYRDQNQQMQRMEAEQFAEVIAAATEHEMLRNIEQQHVMARFMGVGNVVDSSSCQPLELVSPHIGGFQGSLAVLQQKHGGQVQEGSGAQVRHVRRSFDDGRNGVGPSSS
ncbi:LOB domain-containing protein 25-like [Phalaenopsis equestris]|uniref:LOB domain-containing protein 25-like n=1 Tax=Phalaenopsis equestris TaxID=78828 RepID=UPI0009E57527|nr:LOB domain-containing protein 25-like [Phalaenopsis equestris]XP_020579154.1 LOB domain-containing protein 25-like [Phalaenopsis equestris]